MSQAATVAAANLTATAVAQAATAAAADLTATAVAQPTATPVPGQPTATPIPGQPTATPIPGQPTATPVPGEVTATPIPGQVTATPVPGQVTATPVPGEPTATPVPGQVTVTLVPGEPTVTPSATNTATATDTATPNAAELTAVAGGATLTPSNTPKVTPSATNTATPNAAELTAVAGGATLTPSNTPTRTASPTRTVSPTATPKTSGKPKLNISIRGPKQVVPGKGAFFILAFVNAGDGIAFKPRLIMVLPLYTLFDLANSTPGWVLLKTASTQAGQLTAGETYVFEPGDLNASQSGEVTFATTVQADAPTGTTLNAEVSIGDSTSTGSTATAKSNTAVEVVDKFRSYLPLITR